MLNSDYNETFFVFSTQHFPESETKNKQQPKKKQTNKLVCESPESFILTVVIVSLLYLLQAYNNDPFMKHPVMLSRTIGISGMIFFYKEGISRNENLG